MTTPASLLDRLAPQVNTGVRAERGRTWFRAHGFPNPRQEAWRYTPVDEIARVIAEGTPGPHATAGIDAATIDRLAGSHGGPRMVFLNGALARELSDLDSEIQGLVLAGVDDLRPRRRPDQLPPTDEPADGFHALNWAAGRDVAGIIVESDTTPDVPVHVVHLAVPGESVSVSHPRTVIAIRPRSRATVIESFVGLGGRAVTNSSTRIVVGDDATLTYHRLMAEPEGTIHVARTAMTQSRGSTVNGHSIICGGDIVRNAIEVTLSGDGATSNLEGLYLPIGSERHDNMITVDHAASHGRSMQRFKGIVDDHGRGSFSGHVIVRHGTVGNDADQSNPNLVLTPAAQADSRPWLEIYADDVACNHGATVGRLDSDALFYLRSRGIPATEARSMLVAAFAAEILDAVEPTSLREWLDAVIARRHGSRTA
ncbi:MAG: Fe-S cluster assembly protein SufD [Microthrixaceae bacterium]